MKFLDGSIEREQSIYAEQKSRGVAAPSSESARDGNALRETHAHAARANSRCEERPCPLEDVGLSPGNGEAARLEREALPRFLEEKLILEGHGLQDRVDLVIAVGAASQDPESEV